ncbi:MAG: alpha-amylase, partial [Marinilabiliales bacterium]
MIKKITTMLFMLLVTLTGFSQVSSDPAFPLDTAPVTIMFDATGTALDGYTGDLYTHTGVIIEGNSNWQHVIGDWGNNTNQPQLTRTGTNTYELEITPDIRTFYEVEEQEVVEKMAFVFRAAAGSPQSADLFIDVFSNELSILISEPAEESVIVGLEETLDVVAGSPSAETLQLWL